MITVRMAAQRAHTHTHTPIPFPNSRQTKRLAKTKKPTSPTTNKTELERHSLMLLLLVRGNSCWKRGNDGSRGRKEAKGRGGTCPQERESAFRCSCSCCLCFCRQLLLSRTTTTKVKPGKLRRFDALHSGIKNCKYKIISFVHFDKFKLSKSNTIFYS